MVVRYKGVWFVHPMCHCSCYTELEKFQPQYDSAKAVKTLDELLLNATEDYIADVKPLVDKLKSEGYK